MLGQGIGGRQVLSTCRDLMTCHFRFDSCPGTGHNHAKSGSPSKPAGAHFVVMMLLYVLASLSCAQELLSQLDHFLPRCPAAKVATCELASLTFSKTSKSGLLPEFLVAHLAWIRRRSITATTTTATTTLPPTNANRTLDESINSGDCSVSRAVLGKLRSCLRRRKLQTFSRTPNLPAARHPFKPPVRSSEYALSPGPATSCRVPCGIQSRYRVEF